MEEINRLFDGNTVEEIVENLKKEGSEWAEKQLNTLNKMVCTYTIKFIYVKKNNKINSKMYICIIEI